MKLKLNGTIIDTNLIKYNKFDGKSIWISDMRFNATDDILKDIKKHIDYLFKGVMSLSTPYTKYDNRPIPDFLIREIKKKLRYMKLLKDILDDN